MKCVCQCIVSIMSVCQSFFQNIDGAAAMMPLLHEARGDCAIFRLLCISHRIRPITATIERSDTDGNREHLLFNYCKGSVILGEK